MQAAPGWRTTMRVCTLPLGSRTWSRLIFRKPLWSMGVLLTGVSVRFMVVPLGWLGQPEMLGLRGVGVAARRHVLFAADKAA